MGTLTLRLLPVLLLAGCANLGYAEEAPAAPVTSDKSADWHWQHRDNEKDLRTAIALFEQDFARQPSVDLCNQLCRGYYLLADYYLEDNAEAQAPVQAKAVRCALKGLKLQKGAEKLIGDDDCPSADAIAHVDKEHAGPLFWWAAHFGRWMGQKNLVTQVVYRGRFVAALERVQKLDDTIFGGSLYRTWGAYYAHMGNREKAYASFDHAAELAPPILITRIMYAKECGLRWKDKGLYVKQLQLALKEPEPDIAEILPEFRMERARAQRMLEQADKLFK